MRTPLRALRGALVLSGWLACAACATDDSHYETLTRDWQRARPQPAGVQPADDPLAGAPRLERDALLRLVAKRNPTLAAAHSAWRAALERYPQAVAFDDPMLRYGVAPRSLHSDDVDPGHRVDVSQRLPFPGKRALRGSAALAEAEAAGEELRAARVRLAALASALFDDYYLATRTLEIYREHEVLLEGLQRSALARYEAGEGSQQDPLQAEVERARLAERTLALRNELQLARARINTLVHRDPALPLPPPPEMLEPPALAAQDAGALESRPDLAAAAARVRARSAEVATARREFYPDLSLMGSYEGLMQERELRPVIGFEIELPLQIGRRRAALREARARLEQAEREASGLDAEARYELQRAREELERARALRALYRDVLLPTAERRIEAARAGFESGRNGFSELIEAEHALRDAREGAEQARADESRRCAELLAALGLEPGGGAR